MLEIVKVPSRAIPLHKQRLTDSGEEIPDSKPIAVPVEFQRGSSLFDRYLEETRQRRAVEAALYGDGSLEDDFEIEDLNESSLYSPYEDEHFPVDLDKDGKTVKEVKTPPANDKKNKKSANADNVGEKAPPSREPASNDDGVNNDED
ncbi:MAG: hypothetical protein [Arizlama microvirus]|nr:MAG: hypothetical protein [Arizlama microvirus]